MFWDGMNIKVRNAAYWMLIPSFAIYTVGDEYEIQYVDIEIGIFKWVIDLCIKSDRFFRCRSFAYGPAYSIRRKKFFWIR